jgi:ABC-type transport system involved in cytochrome c biogenesis permease subunit
MTMFSPMLLLIPASGYVFAAALNIWRSLRRTDAYGNVAAGVVWLSLSLHAFLLAVRVWHVPPAPLTGAREFTVLLALLLVVAYLISVRGLRKVGVGEVALAIAGAILVPAAVSLSAVPAPAPDVLSSPWLLLHVPLCLLAYLMYALAGSGGIVYLVVSSLLKARRPLALARNMPTLESLDVFSYRMAGIAFPLLTAGIMAGMVWSHEAWGELIPETPKQLLALVTWAIYAAYFHARLARGVRGRFCAWLLVFGFALVVAGLLVPIFTGGPHKFI